jgi:hypothetical protein
VIVKTSSWADNAGGRDNNIKAADATATAVVDADLAMKGFFFINWFLCAELSIYVQIINIVNFGSNSKY